MPTVDERSSDAFNRLKFTSADFRRWCGNESDRPNEGRPECNILLQMLFTASVFRLPEPPVCRKEGARPWNQKRHFERSLQTAQLHQKPIPYPSGGQSQATVASCTEAPPTHNTKHQTYF